MECGSYGTDTYGTGEKVSIKPKLAKAEARIAQYQLQDAREKIELQVNQAAFKV